MKKNPQNEPDKNERSPRTEQDEKFLALVTQIMSSKRISSERAFSLELGRGPDFISRIRRGIQSAPADAWDTLLTKYPEARNITNITQSGANAIGTLEGNATYTINDCEKERDSYKGQVEQLRSQLADRERLIASLEKTVASQDEILSLLRSGSNRTN